MSIASTDILHALAQRPVPDANRSDNRPVGNRELFASRLQETLAANNNADLVSRPGRAKAVAELLNLQMLQATISLSGEGNAQAVDSSQSAYSSVKALLASYAANLPESVKAAQGESSASMPDAVKNISASQLQDLAGAPPAVTNTEQVKSYNSPAGIDRIIAAASQRYGVDAGLIKAVIKAESNFNPQAVSHAGAQGLMQLMPGTARALGVSDSFDPEQNVMGGTRFLRDMLKRYNGNIDSALAAYNWGPGNVDRRPDSLPRETRDYQARVKQLYAMYSA